MARLVYTATRLTPEASEWLRRRAERAEHGVAAELRQIVRAAREREAAEREREAR